MEKIDEHLVQDYLNGKLTEQQKQELKELLAKDESARTLFESHLIYESALSALPEKEKSKFLRSIDDGHKPTIFKKIFSAKKYFAAAAAVLIALIIGTAVVYQNFIKKPIDRQITDKENISRNFNDENANFVLASYHPPIEGIDVKKLKQKVNTNKEQVIRVSSQTKLTIPAACFVDASGKDIQGEVDLEYREIIKPAEIIASGVPMTYDTGGVTQQFETAGMVEINATYNNQPVFLKKGKSIDIEMVSGIKGNFNYYNFDHRKNNWEFAGVPETDVNMEDSNTTLNSLRTNADLFKPIKVDMKNDVILNVKANYSSFPELKPYRGVLWKYLGKEKPDDILYTIHHTIWSNSEVKKGPNDTIFILQLTSGRKKFEFEVTPVISQGEYKNAITLFNEKQTEVENLKLQKNFERKFSIISLGLCNLDRVYPFPSEAFFTKVDLKCKGTQIPMEASVYQIIGEDNNIIIRYSNIAQLERFVIDPKQKCKVVALFPDKQIAFLKASDYQRLKLPTKNMQAKDISLNLTLHDKKMNSVEDLQEVIERL
jgi:hypothetical protein